MGFHVLPPREAMPPAIRKWRDTYDLKPNTGFYQKEFGFFTLDAWKKQGMPSDVPLHELFGFDPPATVSFGGLGWCEAAFEPAFEEKVLEDRGDYELVQDVAGRQVLFFKNRRSGFMPEYVAHPVKDWRSWEEEVKWRLDPKTASRYAKIPTFVEENRPLLEQGAFVIQRVVGGICIFGV